MALDLGTPATRRRRSHVRATHLINGGVYRPKRYRSRRGRHRAPSVPRRFQQWLSVLFAGDIVTLVGFYALIGAGTLSSAAGLLLHTFTELHREATWATIGGTLLLVFAAAAIGFSYIDPSPDE